MTKITSKRSILKGKSINFVDMHHHSTVSDGLASPRFIAKVFMRNGFGVCIADHNKIAGSVYLAKLAKKKKVFTIPSIEVTSSQQKDILGYFYSVNDLVSFWEKEIKGKTIPSAVFNYNMTNLSTTSLVEKIGAYGGVPVLPHPLAVYPKKSYMLLKDKQFLRKIKAIESHNFGLGRYLRTRKAVEKFRKPLTAGSDSHTISWFNTLTGSKEFDAGSFLDSIIKGKNIIYCKNNHYAWRMLEQFAMLRNNIQTPRLLKQAKAKNIS